MTGNGGQAPATQVQIVQSFRNLTVLVIGDAMLDSYLEGSATRLCREGPVPVVRKRMEEHMPGGGANTAANLRALGAEVRYIGLVGRDIPGALLRAGLKERDVDDGWLVEDDHVSTLHKQRILCDEQYVVRFDSGETEHCGPAARKKLLDKLERAFMDCDLVVISDYRYGLVDDALIERLVKLRARRSCPLAVDSKDLAPYARAHATIVTPNHLEAQLAIEPSAVESQQVDVETVAAVGRRLLEVVDAEAAAVTMAHAGVLLVGRDGRVEHLDTHPVARANDVGAGDSFLAAAALALAAGAGLTDAARIALSAGSIAVTQRRTAVVQHQDLLQRVSRETRTTKPGVEQLLTTIEACRSEGRRIVFTNGVFDILHAGHVHFLRKAKTLGDLLVVGVNSDQSARRLKGPNRPINSERDRLALVAALDAVDYVALFDEDDPADLIRQIRPHLHVKGGDYAGQDLPEIVAVREVGAEVVILPLVNGTEGVEENTPYSTSDVIGRIMALASTPSTDLDKAERAIPHPLSNGSFAEDGAGT